MGVNQVIIVGNLGAQPEMRFTPSGRSVTNFRVAASRRYIRNDETIEETEWFPVVTFGKIAESCNQFLDKGSQVYVQGRLHTHSWEDKEGQKHYRIEVIASSVQFLSSKKQDGKTEAEETEVVDVRGETVEETVENIKKVLPARPAQQSNKKVVKK